MDDALRFMDRKAFDNVEAALREIRLPHTGLIINVGAHQATQDCPNGYMSATLRRGEDEFTGEAVALFDAVLIANGRLDRIVKNRQEEKEKAKKERARG